LRKMKIEKFKFKLDVTVSEKDAEATNNSSFSLEKGEITKTSRFRWLNVASTDIPKVKWACEVFCSEYLSGVDKIVE